MIQEKFAFIVPTTLVVEELYTQIGFLFRQFWLIDIFIARNVSGTTKKLVQRRMRS